MFNINSIRVLVVTFILLLISGCTSMKPISPEKIIGESQDPHISKAVIMGLTDKKYDVSHSSNKIIIKQIISIEQGSSSRSVGDAIGRYHHFYDASKDKIAQVYINSVKKRGNIVKMYKNNVNGMVVNLISMPYDYRSNLYPTRSNIDVVLIEHDKKGRINSALFRAHTFPDGLGSYGDRRYSVIMFLSLAKNIEYRIGNDVLNDGYITTLK